MNEYILLVITKEGLLFIENLIMIKYFVNDYILLLKEIGRNNNFYVISSFFLLLFLRLIFSFRSS